MSAVKKISALPQADNLTSIIGLAGGVASLINAAKVLNCRTLGVPGDLDNAVTPGFYHFPCSAEHSPVSGNAAGLILMVFSHTDGYIQQVAFCLRSTPSMICFRLKDGPTAQWGAWRKIEFTSM